MYVGLNGRTRSLPVTWTSVAPDDLFVALGGGFIERPSPEGEGFWVD